MNFGVEAEGIDFILRFRDAASDQIGIAEKSYQRLISAMQSLIQTQRAFGDATRESLDLVGRAMKNAPFPLATPLTISQDQLSLMAQFDVQATAWFQKISNQLLGYINYVRRATIQTDGFRQSLSNIIKEFQNWGKEYTTFAPILDKIQNLKLPDIGTQGTGLHAFTTDLQKLLQFFRDWVKHSPEVLKAMKLTEQQVKTLDHSLNGLQKTEQTTGFHADDVRRHLENAGNAARGAKPKFDLLMGTMGKLSQMRWAIGGLGGLALTDNVQKFSSLEQAAFRISQRIDQADVSMKSLTKTLGDLTRQSGYDSVEIAQAFDLITQKSGHIVAETGPLALAAIRMARVTGASQELVASIGGELVGAFGMSEKSVEKFLNTAYVMSRGAKTMSFTDFLQNWTQNLNALTGTADQFGMSLSQLSDRALPAFMAFQKTLAQGYANPEEASKLIKAVTTALSPEAGEFRKLLNWSDQRYTELIERFRSEGPAPLYEAMIESIQSVFQHGDANMRQAMSEATGIDVERLNELYRALDKNQFRLNLKVAENQRGAQDAFQRALKSNEDTWDRTTERLSSRMTQIQRDVGQSVKGVFAAPLIWMDKAFAKGSTGPGSGLFNFVVGTVSAVVQTAWDIASKNAVLTFIGFGGMFPKIFARLPIYGKFFQPLVQEAQVAGRAAVTAVEGMNAAASSGQTVFPKVVGWLGRVRTSAAEAAANLWNMRRAGTAARAATDGSQMAFDFDGSQAAARLKNATQLGFEFETQAVRTTSLARQALTRAASVIGRVASVAGWVDLVAHLGHGIDNLTQKLGIYGTAVRLIIFPLIQFSNIVLAVESAIWKAAKAVIGFLNPIERMRLFMTRVFGPDAQKEVDGWKGLLGAALDWVGARIVWLEGKAKQFMETFKFGWGPALISWLVEQAKHWKLLASVVDWVGTKFQAVFDILGKIPVFREISWFIDKVEASIKRIYEWIRTVRDAATDWFKKDAQRTREATRQSTGNEAAPAPAKPVAPPVNPPAETWLPQSPLPRVEAATAPPAAAPVRPNEPPQARPAVATPPPPTLVQSRPVAAPPPPPAPVPPQTLTTPAAQAPVKKESPLGTPTTATPPEVGALRQGLKEAMGVNNTQWRALKQYMQANIDDPNGRYSEDMYKTLQKDPGVVQMFDLQNVEKFLREHVSRDAPMALPQRQPVVEPDGGHASLVGPKQVQPVASRGELVSPQFTLPETGGRGKYQDSTAEQQPAAPSVSVDVSEVVGELRQLRSAVHEVASKYNRMRDKTPFRSAFDLAYESSA